MKIPDGFMDVCASWNEEGQKKLQELQREHKAKLIQKMRESFDEKMFEENWKSFLEKLQQLHDEYVQIMKNDEESLEGKVWGDIGLMMMVKDIIVRDKEILTSSFNESHSVLPMPEKDRRAYFQKVWDTYGDISEVVEKLALEDTSLCWLSNEETVSTWAKTLKQIAEHVESNSVDEFDMQMYVPAVCYLVQSGVLEDKLENKKKKDFWLERINDYNFNCDYFSEDFNDEN